MLYNKLTTSSVTIVTTIKSYLEESYESISN